MRYGRLQNEAAKAWHFSPLLLARLFDDERNGILVWPEVRALTFETMKFKIWCIEKYRRAHDMTAPETADLFKRYGVFQFLEMPALQWQSLENTVMDIEEFIEVRS